MLKGACISLLIATLTLAGCKGGADRSAITRDELLVAMDEEMPGYFVLGGEAYGYQYDLLSAYADARNKKLRVIDSRTASLSGELLRRGEIDLLATRSDRVGREEQAGEVAIYRTSYVLLAPRKRAAALSRQKELDLIALLREGKLLVSAGFKGSKSYNTLLDSLPGNVWVSSRNSFELISAVGDGSYDYLVCELSEAQLGCALDRRVEAVRTFDEPVSMSVVATPADPALRADFEAWLSDYRATEEYALLTELYFEKGIVAELSGGHAARPGRISRYDDIIKRLCEREGYDWRLISAIAYSESRFNPYVVSRQGARGLMQVMPRTARQLGSNGDLFDPEHNVLLALKLLGKIERSLAFADETSQEDRIRIILACYNAGIGHVQDARYLARKRGGDPDRWADVSACLTLKSDPEVLADEAIKCGRFSGRQTLAFVAQVLARYDSYCNRVQR